MEAQLGLGLPVRMGIATGEAEQRGDDYFGPALNRVARVMDAGHGGQVLSSAISYAQSHAHQRGDVLGQIKASRHAEVAAALHAEADKAAPGPPGAPFPVAIGGGGWCRRYWSLRRRW